MSEFSDTFGEWASSMAVTVERYKGRGSAGPVYEPAAELPGAIVMSQNRLVRNSEGNQVISSTAVYADGDGLGLLTLHSRVLLDGAVVGTVATLSANDTPGLFEFTGANLE